jgi:hypothetical protein
MRTMHVVLPLLASLLSVGACASGPAVTSGSATSSSAAASSAAAAPTPSAPAPTTTPATPRQDFSGKGSDVIKLAAPVQLGILRFSCPKCSGNTVVKTDADVDNLMVNAVGKYSGTRWIGTRGDTTSRVQITATGSWTITIGGIDLVPVHDGTDAVKGTGDDVWIYRVLPSTVAVTHTGRSNFVVQEAMDGLSSPDLAVNEIGSYEGTVLFPGDGTNAGLVQITADGAWSVTPKP